MKGFGRLFALSPSPLIVRECAVWFVAISSPWHGVQAAAQGLSAALHATRAGQQKSLAHARSVEVRPPNADAWLFTRGGDAHTRHTATLDLDLDLSRISETSWAKLQLAPFPHLSEFIGRQGMHGLFQHCRSAMNGLFLTSAC